MWEGKFRPCSERDAPKIYENWSRYQFDSRSRSDEDAGSIPKGRLSCDRDQYQWREWRCLLSIRRIKKTRSGKNKDDYEDICDELVLIASRKYLDHGNVISPQFPILIMLDLIYSYYLEHDKKKKETMQSGFNVTTDAMMFAAFLLISSYDFVLIILMIFLLLMRAQCHRAWFLFSFYRVLNSKEIRSRRSWFFRSYNSKLRWVQRITKRKWTKLLLFHAWILIR